MEITQLHKDQFNRLYPFHLFVDPKLLICQTGDSLNKLLPGLKGQSLDSCFQLIRPQLAPMSFAELKGIRDLVILKSLASPDILLRGQLEYLQDAGLLLFACTPWFNSMEQLRAKNLTITDFSVSDSMIDLLHVIKTEEIVSNEVRELLDRVNLQKNESQLAAQRLSQLITSMHSGILLEDEFRRIVLINESFCRMFGIPLSPEQMKGADCSQSAEQTKHLFRDPEEFVTQINHLLQEKRSVKGEVIELADGRFFERDYIPMFIKQQYRGHLWNYTDITERVRKETLIRKSEEKYRGIITNINLGLVEVALDETILYVNQGFCKLSGYREDELVGKKSTRLLLSDPDAMDTIKHITAKRKKGIADLNEIQVTIKNGERRWWAISGAPLYDDQGKIVGSIGIHMDITHQKVLEQQLRESKNAAEKAALAKENFLANMSHEIRTPLSGIYGMMQLLQNTRLNKEQQSYIEYIDKAIENLQTIINDILDLSKINAGMMHIEQVPFAIREEMNALYHLHLPKAEAKGLTMKLEMDDSLSHYYIGDPHRINQVITNLVGNAIKFTQEGSICIRCSCLKPGDAVDEIEFMVSDTGIGIEEQFLHTLFEKFTQEDMSHSRKYGGTGLGMNICKNLTEMMGGHIGVESKKMEGTSIRVVLPLQKRRDEPGVQVQKKVSGRLTGKKILIAEDNEINAKVIKSMLTQEGALVTIVSNGKALIEVVPATAPEIIISDLQMPVMNGMEVARWIRKNHPHPALLVALTANALAEERTRCLEAGFDEVLFKPFRREDLINACLHKSGRTLSTGTATSPAPHEGLLYDLKPLTEMVDHDQSQVRMLVTHFIRETPDKLKRLQECVKEKNHAEIRRIAHYLSSSVQHLNIHAAYQTISDLEHHKFARSPRKLAQEVHSLVALLHTAMDQLRENFISPLDAPTADIQAGSGV